MKVGAIPMGHGHGQMMRRNPGFVEHFRQTVADFRHTGSLSPSSRWFSREMARPVAEFKGKKKVLEVGPGGGPITRAIVPHLSGGDVFDLVEINEKFCEIVERDVLAPARKAVPGAMIRLFQGPVQEVPLQGPYDVIVSALPFNNFEPELVKSILNRLESLLGPQGQMRFFEYTAIRRLKGVVAGGKDRARLRGISGVLKDFHGQGGTRTQMVLANFPPTTMHILERGR